MANYDNAFTRGTNLNNVNIMQAKKNKRLLFRAKMDERQKLYLYAHPRNQYQFPFKRQVSLLAHSQNPLQ